MLRLNPCFPNYQTIFYVLKFFLWKFFEDFTLLRSTEKLDFGGVFSQWNTDQKSMLILSLVSILPLILLICSSDPFFFHAYWASHLQSGSRLLRNHPVPFSSITFQFNLGSYSSQHLTQVLSARLLAWTAQGWVIALWLLFCFQFSVQRVHNSAPIPETGGWPGPCYARGLRTSGVIPHTSGLPNQNQHISVSKRFPRLSCLYIKYEKLWVDYWFTKLFFSSFIDIINI